MSLDFVAGAVFMLGVFLIGAWLRDRWRYRLGSGRTLPPRLKPDTLTTPLHADVAPTHEQPRSGAGECR